jgi:hypothetical protein
MPKTAGMDEQDFTDENWAFVEVRTLLLRCFIAAQMQFEWNAQEMARVARLYL